MSEWADLRSINSLVEHCLPGEWGIDPVGGASNCVVYRATDIDNEGHLRHNEGAERVVLPNKVTAKALKANDIIVEASGGAPDKPVGRVALFSGSSRKPALVSNFFRAMRPRSGVDAKFLTFQLVALNRSSAIWRYQQQTTGLINLKVTDYLKHRVWMPALSVQQKIGAILTSLDTAIEKTEALIEKHQQIKAGLMHDLYTRGVLPNGQLRPPREQSQELYSETALGWIPVDWHFVRLGELAKIVTGVTLGAKESPADTIEAPYLRVANVQDGYLDLAEIKTVRISGKTLEQLRLRTGDVLMNEGGDFDKLGRGAVWAGELENCVHQNHVFRVRTDGSRLLPHYLALYSESTFGKKYFLLSSKQSTNLASINSTQLNAYPIAVPDSLEQQRIVQRLGGANARIGALKAGLSKQRSQKLGLMQDLLTGKVPVTVEASIAEPTDA